MPRVALLTLSLTAFVLLAVQVQGGGAAAIAASHRALDRQLERADKDVLLAAAALNQEAQSVAEAVARSEALQTALGERVARGEMPDATALDAASGALAERPAAEGRSTLLVLVTEHGFAESRLGEAPRSGEGPRVTAASEALGGKATGGMATVDDRLYRVVAVPVGAGQKPLGALVLGFPVDDAYATRLSQASGAEVSVVRGGKVLASTLPPAERAQVGSESAKNGMLPFGFGTVPPDAVRLLGFSVPWLARGAASERAATQPVPGVEDARLILSLDEVPTLGFALDLQRRGILSAAAVLALSLLLLPLARSRKAQASAAETPGPMPEPVAEMLAPLPSEPAFGPPEPQDEMATAAHTDPFGRGGPVRPPVEKTLVAPVSESSRPPSEPTQPRPADNAWPDAFAGLPGSGSYQAEPPTVIANALSMDDPFAGLPVGPGPRVALEATRVAEPAVQAALLDSFAQPPGGHDDTMGTLMGVPAEQTVVAMVPQALLKATSRPAEADPESLHFQEVFREFLEVRRHCGEPVDGITFDRFAAKLRKNRDQLVEKYRCKAVRFTVYVKDGKTALKAVPVRD